MRCQTGRVRSLALFVDPGFFEEVGAVRIHRRICGRHPVACIRLALPVSAIHVHQHRESDCDDSKQQNSQPDPAGR